MRKFLALSALFSFFALEAAASSSRVAASIAPVHSLVQAVMGDTGKAELLVQGNVSPHATQLKPSQMKMLQQSTLVFYIDAGFETFLPRALRVMPDTVRPVALMDQDGIRLLDTRSGANWEVHSHDDHDGHKDHDTHETHGKHKDHDDHDDHDHNHHHGHSHGANVDAHVWLDPENAITMVKVITKELSRAFPENRTTYKANARAMISQIETVDEKLKSELSSVGNRPFIVFHDAYQYFERHYGLQAVGSIVLDPAHSASAKRITELRKKVADLNVVCVFREPQFPAKLSNIVIEGSTASAGVLDPLGANLSLGPGLYLQLLENMSKNFISCIKKAS
ncbi:zinc ABC transporter substrate-binding protein [Sneathiella glossodoripedis]|uniref:zinc ABC transporter substrate-binding protein n=1 Tax=Sneathiella glossodoripedis TaxID=418853 RepID=UPI00046F6B86|nr:zinc ABC transporter substrate-binding protein [Sneathiella glossodoripedis]